MGVGKRPLASLLALLGCLLAWAASAGAEPKFKHGPEVVVDEAFDALPLGTYAAIAIDRSGTRSAEAMHRAFERDDPDVPFRMGTSAAPNLSYESGAVWLRTRIHDRRRSGAALVVDVEYAPLDFVDAFAVVDGVTTPLGASGDHVAHERWPRATVFPSFELPAAPTVDLWLRVQGESSLQIPAVLRTRDAAQRDELRRAVTLALYCGALLAMAIYNLLVYASTRERAYLFYVAFLASHGTMVAALSGAGFALVWSPLQPFSDMVIPRAIACTGIAGIFFARELLRVARAERWLLTVSRALLGALVAVLVSSLAMRCGPVVRMALVVTFAWIVFMIGAGVAAMKQGERVARFYLLAWACFAIGGASQALVNLDVLPSTSLTRNLSVVGSALEFLLLSFALADRLKSLQAEATANAELAASNARMVQEATARSLSELQRLDQAKDEFLANTSHELRTPIHGVTGLLEALLARATLAESERQDVAAALAAAQRLAALVSTVLDFSEFRSGSMFVAARSVDLAAIVEHEVAARRDETRVPIRVGALERRVAALGEAGRLRQLVVQLLANAVKFTRTGAIDVSLVAAGETLAFEVRDTGIGIDPARLEALLRGLEQGDGSATREAGGLGIGLALAKRIAEAHGGEFIVRSALDMGTTVRVVLPGIREAEREHAAPAASAQVAEPPMATLSVATAPVPSLAPRASESPALPPVVPSAPSSDPLALLDTTRGIDEGTRLLVADDDPMNRRVIRTQLAPFGFELVDAEDGADALEKIANDGPFDAVLLDVMMPKANGYDVCRTIRETTSATELPVLMLTAKAQARDLLEGFAAGANDYVPKPFSKVELLARIRTHVTIARTHRSLRRFVPQGALEILGHENVVDVRLGDTTERELAILFADLRGFTALSQQRAPAEVFALLNRCYARLGPAVRAAGGFVDKYIGDGLMALFPKGADAAVRAAVAMQRALDEPVEGESLRIGLGVHVGPTLLGTLGEPDRFDATVISDAVNLASRIEGASKQLGAKLLVSKETFDALTAPASFEARPLGRVQVKGRQGFVEVVEILDAEDPEAAALKSASRALFAEGLAAFRAREWRSARERFEAVVDAHMADTAAVLYLAAATFAEEGDERAVGPGCALALREK